MSSEYHRRVHVGGHHEVYCNGAQHITISGDGWGSAPLSDGRDGARIVVVSGCDCASYQAAAQKAAAWLRAWGLGTANLRRFAETAAAGIERGEHLKVFR